ncbi:MAG: ATP-dependent Clp protease proteolytic subunit [Planctomycetes bacterium GWF2_40_8]|nr:MAG: ATP-dependent Clp protease proteolytic subunit [Planctomycetes bacterium GWF2_40_8]OHB89345.1 MAG: ATP-dependent Clp protease proteolytic subunit [Planctomycetes bacterium RIFCSPHIGHO2_02_FULL_40_12]OHC01407.1 MAG: ATP-dependent Clp protease proteolytic subunit [Planctomycetes bacterium RIFCSPLOWO2_12_FULL_40_19]
MKEINFKDDVEKDNQRLDLIGAKLMKNRTIMITDVITKRLAQRTIAQLLIMEQEYPEKEIKVFINSPGGDADAGFAIYDMMKFVKPRIINICAGVAASAAVIILLGTGRENRISLPNARILIHQPSTGVHGTASDIQIEASEILKCREKINRMIAEETNQAFEKVENDTKRNYWMSAEEAVKYGLISKIIKTHSDLL